jgi:hypothetical protein
MDAPSGIAASATAKVHGTVTTKHTRKYVKREAEVAWTLTPALVPHVTFTVRFNWETQTLFTETDAMSGQTVIARVTGPFTAPTPAIGGRVTISVANAQWMAGNILAILNLPIPLIV